MSPAWNFPACYTGAAAVWGLQQKELTMRFYLIATVLLSAFCGVVLADDEAPPAKDGKNKDAKQIEEKASYGYGFDVGSNIAHSLKVQSITLKIDALLSGLRDALEGKKPAYPEDELENAKNEHRKLMLTKAAKKNKEEGEVFLAANKKKEGVKTLESGLQYMVLKTGDGPSPGPTDRVTTHYHGTYIDGTVFDSSVERGEPATFALNEVIPGWTEALQLMKVGDKWRLFIPSKLAYDIKGKGPIGPNAVLVFEIELLAIEP